MGNLLFILICLFAVLALVVWFAERYAKPLEKAQQARLSRIIIVLIMLLLVGRLLDYYLFT